MRRVVVVAFGLLMANESGAIASDGKALALASLVSKHSPLLSVYEKRVIALMFSGNLNFSLPANKKISVQADAVVCRASDVDITFHSCNLTFGKRTVPLKGSAAHELFATLVEVGVSSEGAAGSKYESLSLLRCTIDPNEVKQKGGGGADCTFNPGGP
jgi:hypothetical protein